ncbi:20S proteasome subunit beta 2 [Nematocida sp. AWRm77]|nr:20S proteasome subunit beta 2 [Nematocida sp. AWRm77]
MEGLFSSAEARFVKTGTTIVGVRGEDFVVLAADTRSTVGPMVADKHSRKVHKIADNIFCCGAGTAGDIRATTKMAQCALYRFSLKHEKIPSPVHCINILKKHLFSYQGHVQASLILGGVDEDGAVLCGVHPHGSIDHLPYTAQGSGSYAAIGALETHWKENMTVEEAMELACLGIEAGIKNDLYSGSNINLCVIRKDPETVFKTEYLENYRVVGKKEPRNMVYRYPRESIRITKEHIVNLVNIRDTSSGSTTE